MGNFGNKPVIGMIHLAGGTSEEKRTRALEELVIYQEERVNGAIIEDYHGTVTDVFEVLRESSELGLDIVRGVNVLINPYLGFSLANEFCAKFVQFDSVQTQDLELKIYNNLRRRYPDLVVLGGVGFKHTQATGNPLEVDLEEAKSKCEVIVTTGSGTGIETPIEKLREYRELLGNFPLVVGAGVNLDNVYEQLKICDGVIIGSYFKPKGDTQLPIDRKKVRDLMDVVEALRKNCVRASGED